MIHWTQQEENFCEGHFQSAFFRDDEGGDLFTVGVASPSLIPCAERCVEAFNQLTQSEISEICQKIIKCVEEGGCNEDFELPALDNALDILNDCWFTALYVNMLHQDDNLSYVVEGEGDWGEAIGFAITDGKVTYVGPDFFDCMKD